MRYEFGKLVFGEAYTRRGLFSEFYDISVVTVSFWRENSSEKSYNIRVTARGIEGGVGFNLSK